MKHIIRGLVFLGVFTGSIVLANDIYIEQVGDTLDLDITQDGQNNVIGTSVTDMALTGNNMTFAITQTGSTNTIAAAINGNNYTGTWIFTGSSNTVVFDCDGAGGTDCASVTSTITTTGDDNAFTIAIGGTADAAGSTVGFTITGDDSIIDTTVDGTSAMIAVALNNASSLASSGASNTAGTLTSTNAGSVVDLDIDGNGDSVGNTVIMNVTGGGSSYDVTQSGIYDNTVNADFSGDGQDVDIIQSD